MDRWFFYFALAVGAGTFLAVTVLWCTRFNKSLLICSLALVVCAFAVDRIFTGKVQIETHMMDWSTNGEVPWGHVALNEHGEAPVALFERVKGGYCYDTVDFAELKRKLIKSGQEKVEVKYNKFIDFGKERGYSLASVDGILFNDGKRSMRDVWSEGGFVETSQ